MNISHYKNLFETYLNNHLFKMVPQNLYEPVNYILQLDSKRVRPSLMLAVADLYNKPTEPLMEPAFGIEIFHNFTLVHDDIMDKSLIRRGKPTVDQKFGLNAAILSGDVMQFLAAKKIAHVSNAHLPSILKLYHQTAIEVCEGQQMDMDFETTFQIFEPEYLRMIELKTAVLLACSLKMGGILCDVSESDSEHLYAFGIHIGIAFQIQDDLLDSFGETAKVGKRIGGDICNNKKTLLLIKAMQTQQKYEKEILYNWLQTAEFNEQKVHDVQSIFESSGARKYTEQKMMHYYDSAMKALDKIQVAEEKKTALRAFADMIVSRNV